MSNSRTITYYDKLCKDASLSGYFINPDRDFALELAESLVVNLDRYSYPACPCRLASGKKPEDLDIICPCDYRDDDISDFQACYCGLYVSEKVYKGEMKLMPIPERRKPVRQEQKQMIQTVSSGKKLSQPVWRCKVCGYLCAREHPPDICPICKAKKERFEPFLLN